MAKYKSFNVGLKDETCKELQRIANLKNCSRTTVARHAIEVFLARQNKTLSKSSLNDELDELCSFLYNLASESKEIKASLSRGFAVHAKIEIEKALMKAKPEENKHG
jgi:hypothetical protein